MQSTMTVRPTEKLREALKSIAKNRGLTVNALVISILWDFVKKTGKEDNHE